MFELDYLMIDYSDYTDRELAARILDLSEPWEGSMLLECAERLGKDFNDSTESDWIQWAEELRDQATNEDDEQDDPEPLDLGSIIVSLFWAFRDLLSERAWEQMINRLEKRFQDDPDGLHEYLLSEIGFSETTLSEYFPE